MPPDLRAISAQCEKVAPVIDCTPTHATTCSGAGLSNSIEGVGLDGAPTGDVAGGGHVATGAGGWASAVATSRLTNTRVIAPRVHRHCLLSPPASNTSIPYPIKGIHGPRVARIVQVSLVGRHDRILAPDRSY